MFNYGKWVRDGLVAGYGSGEFSGPRVVTLTAGYVANGTLTQDDAAVIAASMEQIDADKAAEATPPEEDAAPPDTPDGVTYQD